MCKRIRVVYAMRIAYTQRIAELLAMLMSSRLLGARISIISTNKLGHQLSDISGAINARTWSDVFCSPLGQKNRRTAWIAGQTPLADANYLAALKIFA